MPAPRPPIPGACACGGCFPSVKLYHLCCIFLLFLVQLKFPEGRAKNEATGQRIPRLFTQERSVLYFCKFETQLGTKAMREEGELGAGGRGHAACAAAGQARGAGGTFPSPPRTLSFSLDTHPCPGGDCCAVGHGQREQLHVPCAQVCMILCKLTANS